IWPVWRRRSGPKSRLGAALACLPTRIRKNWEMPRLSTSVDYEADLGRDKTARPAGGGALRKDARPTVNPALADAPVLRPIDLPAVEDFLQLLARAIRQFHTYPANS